MALLAQINQAAMQAHPPAVAEVVDLIIIVITRVVKAVVV
jgi:hypothetical protein